MSLWIMMKTFEADQDHGIKRCLKQSLRITTVRDSNDIQEEFKWKIEKTNKKYKATAEKKRREKLFEKEDTVMVYLRRERTPT